MTFSFSFSLCLQQAKGKENVCPEVTIAKYLNRKDVQQALHARLVGVKRWALCTK